jgi:hypothetical protein
MGTRIKNRLVQTNQTVFDQADFFEANDYTRTLDLEVHDLTLQVFLDNVAQAWTLLDGTTVLDSQVSAGYVYWNEVSPGIYNVRWRPSALGYWRIILSYVVGSKAAVLDYDVVASTESAASLRVSFAA